MKKLATVGLASLLALGAVTTYVNAEETYQGNDYSVKELLQAADQADADKAAAEKAAADKAAAEKAADEQFLKENGLGKDGSTYVSEEAQANNPKYQDKYDVKLQGLDQKMPGEQGSIYKPEMKEEATKAEKAATETKAAATTKAPAKAATKAATKALPKTSAVK